MKAATGIAVVLLAALALAALAANDAPANAAGGSGTVQIQVIANSDSAADQELKLAVRDRVLAALGQRLHGLPAEQGRQVLADSLTELHDAALQAVSEAGFDYDVTVELGEFSHDGRQYGPLVAVAGDYDLLRISIGQAGGTNWWCVLLPPVCFAQTEGGLTVVSEEELAGILELDEHGQWVLRPANAEAAEAAPRLRIALLEWLRQLEPAPRLAWWQQLFGGTALLGTVTHHPS